MFQSKKKPSKHQQKAETDKFSFGCFAFFFFFFQKHISISSCRLSYWSSMKVSITIRSRARMNCTCSLSKWMTLELSDWKICKKHPGKTISLFIIFSCWVLDFIGKSDGFGSHRNQRHFINSAVNWSIFYPPWRICMGTRKVCFASNFFHGISGKRTEVTGVDWDLNKLGFWMSLIWCFLDI